MLKSLVFTAVAACAVCSIATAASAADQRDGASVRVSFSRAELRDPQSVDQAYARLRRSVARACDSNSIVRKIQQEDRACAATALNSTVAQLAQPLLTARHESASGAMFARGY